jgi:hypothetical protein
MEAETVNEKVAEPAPKTPPKPIELGTDLAIVPTNANELKSLIAVIAEGRGFPERFKTPSERIAATNLATSLMGKRWQLALNNIANVKGQMMIFGELPGALAEMTGEVAEKHVYCIDESYKEICTSNQNLNAPPFAGVCQIQRKGRKLKEFTYTIEQAKQAGQYPAMKNEWVDNKKTGRMIPSDDSPWNKYTNIMLMRKAMNMGVKIEFPDSIGSAQIAEYDADVAPDLEARDVTSNKKSLAEELNEEFGESTEPLN